MQWKRVLRKVINDIAVIDGVIRIIEGLSRLAIKALQDKTGQEPKRR